MPNLILLKEPLLNSLNRRLLSSNIQIPFFQSVTKTFSVELGIFFITIFNLFSYEFLKKFSKIFCFYILLGRLEHTVDISLRDNVVDQVMILFQKNSTLLGKIDTNVHRLERHNITNAFLETALNIKIPSLLCKLTFPSS